MYLIDSCLCNILWTKCSVLHEMANLAKNCKF